MILLKVTNNLERFIKKSMQYGINMYDIKYKKDYLILKVEESDLERIEKLNYFSDIEILKYLGFKGKLLFFKEYIFDFVMLIVFLIGIYLISNIIISIDIKHENKKLIKEVDTLLKEKDIKKYTINKDLGTLNSISDEIVHEHRDFLDWLSINKQGMKYIVSFEERILTNEKKQQPYCHIVAKKDGVIKQIKAISGVNLFERADYVKKGDIIISGQIMLNDKIKDNICAEGEVIAETWYKTTIKVPLNEEKKEYTNKKRYNFSFNNNNLFKDKYINYETKTIFKIGPFKFNRELETVINTHKLTEEEAQNKGITLAKERLLQDIGKNNVIIDEKVLNSELNNSTIILEVFFSVNESIGTTEYFEASDEIDTE